MSRVFMITCIGSVMIIALSMERMHQLTMTFVLMEKGKTMSDLISREELIKAIPSTNADIFENCRNCNLLDQEQVIGIINSMPSVDAEPVRHGHWMPIYERYEDGDYLIGEKCSECGETLSFMPPFCPYCGSKMDEEAVT